MLINYFIHKSLFRNNFEYISALLSHLQHLTNIIRLTGSISNGPLVQQSCQKQEACF